MEHISNSLLILLLASATALPDQARDHFERGRALFEEHDDSGEAMKEAEAEFRRALELDAKLAAAVAYLGFIADDQQRREEALAAYRKALDIDRRCAEARSGWPATIAARIRSRSRSVCCGWLWPKRRPTGSRCGNSPGS